MTRVGDVLQGSLLEEQINLETEAVTRGVARYRRLAQDAIDRDDGASLKPAERLVVYWVPALAMAIKEEHRLIYTGSPGKGRGVYGPVLLHLDPERLAVISVHEMLSRCMSKPSGETFLKMSYAIGSAVLAEIHMDTMRADPEASKLQELERKFKQMSSTKVNQWAKKTLDDSLWSRKVCTQVGAILIDKVLSVATVQQHGTNDPLPAFERKLVYQNNRSIGVIRLAEESVQLIEDGHLVRQSMRPRYLPMLVPPYPWSDEVEGGYVRIRTPFISKPTSDQRKALNNSQRETLYEGLNAINATPWKINQRMVELQKGIYESGGGAGVPKPDVVPMPAKPSDIETNPDSLKRWKAAASEVHTINAKLKGARIEFLQRQSVAEMFFGSDQIYMPCQFDFRLRHYPIPATSPNHHGPDTARACMLFSESVPVTDEGVEFLYIQAANHWGEDKLSFDDRISWTEDNLPQIKEWAQNPEDTFHEWGQAEEPFQFMNCCWAIFDPEFASHLPGHVDGSNNVNQHYGAIGLDPVTAQKVNMLPSNRPHDPYLDALKLVVDELELKHRGGCDMALTALPHLQGKQGRALVKRPCMVRQYNSTLVGAKNQVYEELVKAEYPREGRRKMANYLAKIIFAQVAHLFPASTNLMKWLEACARMMCEEDPSRPISWTSPVGVPIVQPYRNMRKFRIKTIVQDVLLGHRDTDAPVAKRRQIQGLPPNFVHAIDAAHALFTAIESRLQGITTAFVHDSYWAHLSNMGQLGQTLREQFILLHEVNHAMQAYEEWSEAYPGLELPMPPPRGSLDLSQVLKAPYFFA
tara:strand:- start:5295 stop:7721 length:2427 start_codon:yes stop_codon:yes gene_type:complete